MTHAPRRARRGRRLRGPPDVRGAPRGCRRARSTVAFCMPGRGPGFLRPVPPGVRPVCRRPRHGATAIRPRTSSTGRTPRGWVASSATRSTDRPAPPCARRPRRRRHTASASTDGRRSSCSCRPLRSLMMGTDGRRQRSRATRSSSSAGDSPGERHGPRAGGDHLLQGAGRRAPPAPPRPPRCRRAAAPVSRAGSAGTSTPAVSGRSVVEDHVEVLGQRLAPGGQGQPEAELRPGREPLGVGQGQLGPAQGPLPHPGHVPLAGEADLAELGEAEADSHLSLSPLRPATAAPSLRPGGRTGAGRRRGQESYRHLAPG